MGIKKREYRRTPTFVNLKSNTMKKTHITNVRFPLLSSKFQNDSATSFVFLSLNFTVFAHGLTF